MTQLFPAAGTRRGVVLWLGQFWSRNLIFCWEPGASGARSGALFCTLLTCIWFIYGISWQGPFLLWSCWLLCSGQNVIICFCQPPSNILLLLWSFYGGDLGMFPFFSACWDSGGCFNCSGCVVESLGTKDLHSALISLCLLCFTTAFATAACMSSGFGIVLKHLWRSTIRFSLCSSRFLSLSSNSTHFYIRLSW